MKRLSLLALLPFLLAADKPWPQKGDTVYVASEIHESFPALPLLGSSPDVDLQACVPLTAMSSALRLRDDRGRDHKLMGDWSKRLHRDRESCMAQVQRDGLPLVRSSYFRHYLVTPAQASLPTPRP